MDDINRSLVITRADLDHFRCLIKLNKNRNDDLDLYLVELLKITNAKFKNKKVNGIEIEIDNNKEFKLFMRNMITFKKCEKCKAPAFCKHMLNIKH